MSTCKKCCDELPDKVFLTDNGRTHLVFECEDDLTSGGEVRIQDNEKLIIKNENLSCSNILFLY